MKENKFKCALCNKQRDIKKGTWIYFDKDNDVLICERHLKRIEKEELKE